MKKLLITINFIIWCFITLLLVCSIIGIIVLLREDYNCNAYLGESGESAWLKIGRTLINSLIE
jgi:hypothetical protein